MSTSCAALLVSRFDATESQALAQVLEERAQRRIPDEPADTFARNDDGVAYPMSPIAHGPRGQFVARWGPPEDVHSVVRIFAPGAGWSRALDALHDLAAVDAWTCDQRNCTVRASFEFSSVRVFQFDVASIASDSDPLVWLERRPRQEAHVDYAEFGQERGELRLTTDVGQTQVLQVAGSVLACSPVRSHPSGLEFFCLVRQRHDVGRIRVRCTAA